MRDKRHYDLDPCPFCGGKPFLERASKAFVKSENTRVAYVRCTECHARGGRFDLRLWGKTSSSREAEEAAVNAWNTRTSENWIDIEPMALEKVEALF